MQRLQLLTSLLLLFSCESKNSMSVVFGGDVMLDRGVRSKINTHGVAYLMDDLVQEFQKADFVVVNLECPVTDLDAPLTKKFVFKGDPQVLPEIRAAGITHCILANNHSYDYGRDGLISTSENLRQVGIVPVGYGISQSSACEPALLEKNGVRVALFSSVLLPLESWMYLDDSPGMCQATAEQLAARIGQFKEVHSDYLVFVTLHWGVEYQKHPTPVQRQQAKLLVDAGADAIIGHHPHIVQMNELIGDSPVFYSIGNLLFDNANPLTHSGTLVKFSIIDRKIHAMLLPYETEQVKPILIQSDNGHTIQSL
jgi:poly-gamma-glutamate capsule biosynthesis protein CapA/YwtB (metallophosphatase superfamily)